MGFCMLFSVPQLGSLRSIQCSVRGSRVQPFPHPCPHCHTYKCSTTHHSGSCTDFGDLNNEACHVRKIIIAESNSDVRLFDTPNISL